MKLAESIEKSPLRLATQRIAVAQDGTPAIVHPDGRAIAVPFEFRSVLQLAFQGLSLAQLALWLRQTPNQTAHKTGSFRFLAKFLSYLYKNDLLVEPKAIELAEALQSDFTWRDSIAFEDLFAIDLLKFDERRLLSADWTQGAFILLVLFFGLVGTFLFGRQLSHLDWLEPVSDRSLWIVLGAWWIVFSLGRSVRSLFQFINMRLMTTFGPTLRLKCDLLLFSIACDDASRARSRNDFYVIGTFCCLFALTITCVLATLQILPSSMGVLFSFFTLLLLLCELSPFRQSALTEALRSFYIFLDQRRSDQAPEGAKNSNDKLEEHLQRMHVVLCSIWVACLGVFIALPLRFFIRAIGTGMDLNTNSERAAAILLALLGLALIFSFADDIFSGFGGGNGDLRSVRKLWKRSKVHGASLIESRRPSAAELEKLPLIRQLDPQLREILLDEEHAQVFDIEAGKTLCHQGDRDRDLYVVLAGRLAVYKRSSSGMKRMIAFLAPGSILGEIAFFFGSHRTATIMATERSRILAIRHDDRISDLDPGKSKELQLRVWFLQALSGSSLLKDVPADALDALIFAGERFQARPGQKIITEGERGDACFFIIQGQASVVQNFKIVSRLKSGDAFGEIALLRPELLRTATVMADSELLAVRIDGAKFWDLLSAHLPLAIEIEKMADDRINADMRRKD